MGFPALGRLHVLALVVALLLSFLAQGEELAVSVGGKDVTVKYRVLSREISGKDRDAGSQGGALECSFLYYGLLAKGDIAAAAKLTTDPAAATAMWKQYRERVGAADFAKEMGEYFSVGNLVVAEFSVTDELMLVVKTPEYTAGQFYRRVNGKHYVVAGRPSSDGLRALGKVLNDYKDGKIKL